MSWTAIVIPTHLVPAEILEWAAGASSSIGNVDNVSDASSSLTVGEALDAIRLAGCHGDTWFRIRDDADIDIERLPSCRGGSDCAELGGHDLGEVDITVAGDDGPGGLIGPDAFVESMSFRKPQGIALLRAALALAAVAGPQLVFDDTADRVAVVTAADQFEALAEIWPWRKPYDLS